MLFAVIGNQQHGKDSIATFIENAFGLTYSSTSYFALEHFLYDKMVNEDGFDYPSVDAAYQDRHAFTKYFYDEIQAFNNPVQSKLGELLFDQYPVLCGIRHQVEFEALRNKVELTACFWVDASGRKAIESPESISVTQEHATHIINNNGTLESACQQVWSILTEEFQCNPICSFTEAYTALT